MPQESILLPKVGAALLGNARRVVTCPSFFDNNILAIVPRIKDSRYLHYWMTTIDAGEISYPGPVPSLTGSEFLDLLVPIQSAPYQRAIADFLDVETARIDALIAKKRQLMAKLRERLQAVIDHQLDGANTSWSPLKRHTTKIGSGKTPPGGAETYISSGVVFLRSQNVGDGELLLDDVAYIGDEVDEEMKATRVKGGDVLLNITGASIGRVATVPPSLGRANVNQHVCIVRLRSGITPRLIEFNLRSSHAQRFISSIQVGGNRDGLNFEQVGSMPVVLPNPREQTAIMRTLEHAEDKYGRVQELLTKQLELLTEHRQALITAAVTGQLEVPEAAAQP